MSRKQAKRARFYARRRTLRAFKREAYEVVYQALVPRFAGRNLSEPGLVDEVNLAILLAIERRWSPLLRPEVTVSAEPGRLNVSWVEAKWHQHRVRQIVDRSCEEAP